MTSNLRGLNDPVRSRIEAAYDLAPELREAVEALRAAEEWLEGWASAEPYLSTIRAALTKIEQAK